MKPYYQDEAVTLYLGDCCEVLPTLESVEHVFTDPPYARDVYVRLSGPQSHTGSGTKARLGAWGTPAMANKPRLERLTIPTVGKEGRTIHNLKNGGLAKMASGDIGSIDEMLELVALEIARLTQRWALVFSDAETIHRWRYALEDAGMRYARTGIWVKPDAMPQMSGDRPSVGFEPCTITHAQGPMRWNGGGRAAVWTYNTVKKNRPNHPCPKPIEVMLDIVGDFSDEGETVLDPFCGSGTTLVAAKRLGRKAIGIEVDEGFCEEAAKRLGREAKQHSFGFKTKQESMVFA